MLRDVDAIIERIQGKYPIVSVHQLQAKHKNDDDGLWFFRQPNSRFDVQIESSSGNCPFLIETSEHDARVTALSISETISVLEQWLHLSRGAA